MTHTWQAMEVQPVKSFTYGDVAPITNGKLFAISRSRLHPEGAAAWPPGNEPGFAPPHNPGDRIPVREEWKPHFAEAEIDYRDGTSKRFLGEVWFEINSVWSIRQELVNWQPASTMPDWAVRKYRTCLTCVPELREGVWGWATTTTDDERK